MDFLASIAWPTAVVVVVLILRRPVRKLVETLALRVKDDESVSMTLGGFGFEVRRYNPREGDKLAESIADQSLGPEDDGAGDRRDANVFGATAEAKAEAHPGSVSTENAAEALLNTDPAMAMFRGYVELEEIAREMYFELGFPDYEESRGRRPRGPGFSALRIEQYLDKKTRDLMSYLRSVRNGIAHGVNDDYSKEEAESYLRQVELMKRALMRSDSYVLPR